MTEELEERTIPKEERDEASASDFAGKNRSFPILKPEDVAAAAASLGRAGSDNYSTEQIKANIIRIAKRKGAAFVAKLPAAWKESEGSEEFAGDVVDLSERAIGRDGNIELRLIQPGWGTCGYYSKDVLASDGPQAWPAGTHMYLDHPTESESRERPERSVRDLAAVLIGNPEYRENGKVGPGLYAKATVLPQWREAIEALSPYIGVSIRAKGAFAEGEAEGRQGKVITSLLKGESVDFVTKAGAGGKVLAVMESLRQANLPQNGASDVVSTEAMSNYAQTSSASNDGYITTTTTAGTGTVWYPCAPASETTPQEADDMELTEAQERIEALEKELEESKTNAQEAAERAARAEGALAILEAQGEARKMLENVSLPAAAKTRVVTKVTSDPKTNDEGKLDVEALSEAVEAEAKLEADYIESITGAGKVTDQGSSESDTDQTAVKESLGKGLGRFFGLTEDAAKRASEGR